MTALADIPVATVPGDGVHTWASQVRQYAKIGRPGLTLEEHEVAVAEVRHRPTGRVVLESRAVVDCLLYRNRKGHLVGILNHYRGDHYDWDGMLLERAGNVNLWVRPDRRRRGVGRRLVLDAHRRWSIDWTAQTYTAGGRALIGRLIKEGAL